VRWDELLGIRVVYWINPNTKSKNPRKIKNPNTKLIIFLDLVIWIFFEFCFLDFEF